MDLTAAIIENTKAIQDLTAIVRGMFPAAGEDVRKQPSTPVIVPLVDHTTQKLALDYTTDVKPAVLEALKKDRARVLELIEGFGVKKATEIGTVDLPAFLAGIKAI